MNCYNMQHKFGKQLHRSTEWRRNKTPEYEKKRGRRLSDDVLTESFILFAGAAIELQNTKGYCDYGEVFYGVAQGVMRFRYYKVPDDIKKQLVESNFPPQLLAVVVSDLIPLNLITRGGRHTSDKKDFLGKVKCLTSEQLLENESDLSSGRPIQKFKSLNSADTILTNSSIYDPEIEEIKKLREILLQKIEAGQSIQEIKKWATSNEFNLPANFESVLESFHKSDPNRSHGKRKKGTPVHRIMFHGGIEISRRMACYWRNDCRREYNRCEKFIVENLLKKPPPVAPFLERAVTYGPLLNAKYQLYAAECLASKMKTKS